MAFFATLASPSLAAHVGLTVDFDVDSAVVDWSWFDRNSTNVDINGVTYTGVSNQDATFGIGDTITFTGSYLNSSEVGKTGWSYYHTGGSGDVVAIAELSFSYSGSITDVTAVFKTGLLGGLADYDTTGATVLSVGAADTWDEIRISPRLCL